MPSKKKSGCSYGRRKNGRCPSKKSARKSKKSKSKKRKSK